MSEVNNYKQSSITINCYDFIVITIQGVRFVLCLKYIIFMKELFIEFWLVFLNEFGFFNNPVLFCCIAWKLKNGIIHLKQFATSSYVLYKEVANVLKIIIYISYRTGNATWMIA